MSDEPSPDRIGRLLAKLTPAEIRCLELVAKGHTSKEIGRETGFSPHTVDSYLKSATAKLRVTKRSMAAQMLASRTNDPIPKLVYKNWDIPQPTYFADKRASKGEGDRPGDLNQSEMHWPDIHDSGNAPAWPERNQPIAKFFGGENRLPIGPRLLRIVALSIGAAIAMGVLINALAHFSKVISSP